MSLQVCVIFRFDMQGLVVAADFYWDLLSMLTQLGQAQAPAA